MILYELPPIVFKTLVKLEREQPSIYHQVTPYLQGALWGFSESDAISLITKLNEKLGTLALITDAITKSFETWAKALDDMPAEVGSRANPRTIEIYSLVSGNDSIN